MSDCRAGKGDGGEELPGDGALGKGAAGKGDVGNGERVNGEDDVIAAGMPPGRGLCDPQLRQGEVRCQPLALNMTQAP
jgi:hypothetical protein